MNKFFSSDESFVKKNGVERAIVYDTLHTQCNIVKAQGLSKFYKDDMWWFYCNDETLKTLFPFFTPAKIESIMNYLEKKGLLLFSENRKSITTKVDGKKEKTIVAQDVVNESMEMTYREDGVLVTKERKINTVINELIDIFKYIDPSYAKYFRIKSHRKALEEMLIEYNGNVEFLEKLLYAIPMTNKEKYAPVITSPIEFRNKAAKLISFIQRHDKENEDSSMLM